MTTVQIITLTGSFCVFAIISQISGEEIRISPGKTAQTSPLTVTAQPKLLVPERHSPNAIDLTDVPWIPLFANGLDGWMTQDGKLTSWHGTENHVSCVAGGGGWLRTKSLYSDFVFKVEYRLQAGGNTGIGLRCPPLGNPTFTGMEIQLLDDNSPKYKDLRPSQYTGSVYYQVAPSQKAVLKPDGEWNLCEIRCVGDEITVKINDQVVNYLQLNHLEDLNDVPEKTKQILAQRPPVGHIALQSHTTRVDFRNAMVQNLDQKFRSGLQYVDLANGKGESVPKDATVTIHYVGQLADGKRFTDSRDAGKPVTVPLKAVIDGWKEGIQGMKVGGRRRLIVPPELAYGSQGVTDLIPPGSTLVFEVELCGFER